MVHWFKWFNFVSLTKKLNCPLNTSLSIFMLTKKFYFLSYLPYIGNINELVYNVSVLMKLADNDISWCWKNNWTAYFFVLGKISEMNPGQCFWCFKLAFSIIYEKAIWFFVNPLVIKSSVWDLIDLFIDVWILRCLSNEERSRLRFCYISKLDTWYDFITGDVWSKQLVKVLFFTRAFEIFRKILQLIAFDNATMCLRNKVTFGAQRIIAMWLSLVFC